MKTKTLEFVKRHIDISIYLMKYLIKIDRPFFLLLSLFFNVLDPIFKRQSVLIAKLKSLLLKDSTIQIAIANRTYKVKIPDFRSLQIIDIRYEYEYFINILKLMKYKNIKKFDYIISAGAHIGKYIFNFDRKYRYFIAIEPNPIIYKKYLLENIKLNNLQNVYTFMVGLSNTNTNSVKFLIDPFSSEVSRIFKYKKEFNWEIESFVSVYKLDYLLYNVAHLDVFNKSLLIIFDVEGHEMEVLEGSLNILKNNKVVLFLEIELDDDLQYDKEEKILNLLENLGYKLDFYKKIRTFTRNVVRVILSNF